MHMRLWRGTAVVICAIAALTAVEATQRGEKEKFTLSSDEQRLLDLTNAEREQQKLPPLVPNPVLFKVARAHSENMAKQEKMSHVLDDKTPFMRIKEAGYRYRYAGENVAYGDVDMEDVMKGWMASPGHRENILSKNFAQIGLGLARSEKGLTYYTQVFGTPRKVD